MSSGIDHANRPAPPRALYLAAPYGEKARVRDLAVTLRIAGIPVASTWHDIEDPRDIDEAVLCGIAERNHRELRYAAAAVFLIQRGTPRETYVELGAALERSKECLVFVASGVPWQHLPISVYRARVTMEAVAPETVIHIGERPWLTNRIEAWYGTL